MGQDPEDYTGQRQGNEANVPEANVVQAGVGERVLALGSADLLNNIGLHNVTTQRQLEVIVDGRFQAVEASQEGVLR